MSPVPQTPSLYHLERSKDQASALGNTVINSENTHTVFVSVSQIFAFIQEIHSRPSVAA